MTPWRGAHRRNNIGTSLYGELNNIIFQLSVAMLGKLLRAHRDPQSVGNACMPRRGRGVISKTPRSNFVGRASMYWKT